MCTKFEDDIFVRSSVIMKNVILSFIKEYRETTLRSLCDVIDDVITMKIFFLHNLGWCFHCWCQIEAVFYIWTFSKWPPFWVCEEFIIWDDLFISDVKLKLNLILWHFQNGRHFELATKFFTGSDTGSWICYENSHEHLWHFDLLIDVLARILTELLQFKVLTFFRSDDVISDRIHN